MQLSTSKVFRHAIATPLSTINLSGALLSDTKLTPIQRKNLTRIHVATSYISDLVNQITYPGNSTKSEIFDLDVAIAQIIALLDDEYSVFTQVRSYPKSTKCYLVGPKIAFQEAISCLLSNALQAYPENKGQRPILVATHVENQWVRIDIVDLGGGMRWFEVKKAHLPGISSKDSNRGWGLPFAKQIIEQQFAGKLEISSIHNRGTRVSINLPRKH